MNAVVMSGLVVAALAVPAVTPLHARPSQASPYYTPEQLEQIRALPRADDSLRVAVGDLDELLADGEVLLLDVREPKEIEELGTREGYVNIPLLELEQRLDELPKDKAILTA